MWGHFLQTFDLVFTCRIEDVNFFFSIQIANCDNYLELCIVFLKEYPLNQYKCYGLMKTFMASLFSSVHFISTINIVLL